MSFADLLFSSRCFCGLPTQKICSECSQAIKVEAGRTLPGIDGAWSAGNYTGPLKSAIISYKSGDRSQTPILVDALCQVLTVAQSPNSTLVPMPSTAEKVVGRGFDAVGSVTKLVARRKQLEFAPVLRFTRKVEDQVGLTRAERSANLTRAFTANRAISGTVVLVDDVVTTGATAVSAASALRLAGAQKIFLISLCRTEN